MTTHTISTTLLGTGQTYSILNSGGLNVSVGDVLNLTVTAGFPNTVTSLTDVRVSEVGGSITGPVLGENKSSPHTFSYTVPFVSTSARTEALWFYGSRNQTGGYSSAHARIWGTSGVNGERRGYFQLNVAAYACQADQPTGNVLSAYDQNDLQAQTTVTLGGVFPAQTGCTLRVRANGGAWTSAGTMTLSVTRGTNYTYEVAHHGTSSSPASKTLYEQVPYTSPDVQIGTSASNYTTTDGTFTVNLTGVSQAGSPYGASNKYMLKEADGTIIYLNNNNLVASSVGGTSIYNDKPANVPAGTTKSYRVWGKRSLQAGGGSGVARYQLTTASFTVTRAAANTFNEVVTETSGSYFDRNSSAGAGHFLNITSAIAAKYYNVSTSSTSVSSPLLSAWTVAGATSKTFTVTDTPAVPSGANGTTVTYYLWRSDASNGSTPAYTGRSYTRTLVVDDRFSFSSSSVSLLGGVSQFTQTIANTIPGHTYSIKRGSTTLVSAVASGATTTLTITESSLGSTTGDAVTHTLHTQAPLNFAFAYSTGKTYTVTRTAATTPGGYGLEVYAANGTTKLYDTVIRTARLWASATSGSASASGGTVTVNVTGLTSASADDFNIVLQTQADYGGTNSVAASQGSAYTFVVGNGNFVITNNSTIAQTYKYFVFKTGGT